MNAWTCATSVAVVLLAATIARRAAKRSQPPHPPGPTPLPILGNVHQFRLTSFKEWRDKYGDIVYIDILGKPMLILSSHRACVDLLEKRSSIYSNRPTLPMQHDLIGMSWSVVLMPYSARWRRHRRLFHQHFNENASKNYFKIQEQSTKNFLRLLVHEPKQFLQHTHLSFAEPFLRAVYGIKASSYDDPYVEALEKAMEMMVPAGTPGRFLVDLIPILKYVPSWLPGAGFKQYADEARRAIDLAKDLPAEFTMKGDLPDYSTPTVFAQILSQCESEEPTKRDVDFESPLDVAKSISGVTFMAGTDTTVSLTQVFMLLMANHPRVQLEAQAELDSVIGHDRLPTFEDSKDLPYINAIVKELLRWHPAVQVGVPHSLTQDDVYEGYLIPKGTVVLQNLRLILRDPNVYPDPDKFDPSRWLVHTPEGIRINATMPDPESAFGYGRWICPGRYFALNALFITISNVLSCFNISPLDESGKPCENVPERFSDVAVSYPEPYQVSIVPRSGKVLELLKELEI